MHEFKIKAKYFMIMYISSKHEYDECGTAEGH